MTVSRQQLAKAVGSTLFLVLLGLGLRSYHYLRGPSLWHDEAAVILNVLDKSYSQLLGPLFFSEAAPPLFLWVEKAAGWGLGDNTYVWRLVPFLASCVALCLMAPIAKRVLRPEAVPWALLLFACSDRILWHSCESKPYTVDLLCATVFLGVFCWTRAWTPGRQLSLYIALAPPFIFLSYPACFLYGGLMLALLPAVWREQGRGGKVAYGLLALVVGASFLLLVRGPVHAQRNDQLMWFWERQFPHWERPWTVPGWTVVSTFEMLRYCCKPTGGLLGIVAVAGAVALWRGGHKALVTLLLVPIALAVVGAYLKHYPFGHARVELYAAPAVVLCIAAGIAPVLGWCRAHFRPAAVVVVVCLVAPLGLTFYRVANPWERPDSAGATAYVLSHRMPGDAVEGNQWEYEYYFRCLGSTYKPQASQGSPQASQDSSQVEAPPSSGERLWVVAGGPTVEARVRLIQSPCFKDWHVLERCDALERTTIFLLSRR